MFDKYKIVANMDEYSNYLNTVKHNRHDYGDGSHRGGSSYRKSNNNYNSGNKKRRYQKDFKDLDDPDQNNGTNTTQETSNRKLISYDDL